MSTATGDRQQAVAELLATCRTKASLYNEKEVSFLRDVAARKNAGNISVAQFGWLEKLAAREHVDFAAVNTAALAVLDSICERWCPGGKLVGAEYVACNPTRADSRPGSFKINTRTGRWSDFAVDGARGGDPISLAAYLFHNNDQFAAAVDLKRMLGL